MATSLNNINHQTIQAILENYYSSSDNDTAGRGEYVQGTIFSKGRGFGSIIKAVMKAATPLVKKAGRVLKPIAKKAGRYMLKKGVEAAADFTTDVLDGVSPAEAFYKNSEMAIENAKFDALRKISSMKRKPSSKKGPRAKKDRKHPKPNFYLV